MKDETNYGKISCKFKGNQSKVDCVFPSASMDENITCKPYLQGKVWEKVPASAAARLLPALKGHSEESREV